VGAPWPEHPDALDTTDLKDAADGRAIRDI
jgi:hypothetical protein